MSQDSEKLETGVVTTSTDSLEKQKKPLRHRIREIVWDSLDRSPEERRLIFKLDIFILCETFSNLLYTRDYY